MLPASEFCRDRSQSSLAREIALARGVPPMLLGDNTYSNYQEANRSFCRQTVLPLVTRTAKSLSTWLSPAWTGVRPSGSDTMSPPLELRPDLDAIEALSPEREALWTRIDKATFLTQNEKRSAVGYGPVEVSDPPGLTPSDHLASKHNPYHDALGLFTTAEGAVDGSERPQPASRRRSGQRGTPAQEARHAVAAARAREATRRLREVEPTWEAPRSVSDLEGIEGQIAHQEATAEAAEKRLAEILRDAIPNANPSWGINRLRKELNEQGYVFKETTDSPGLLYENPSTGEQVRIMERPPRSFRKDSPQKHFNDYYYRYRRSTNDPYGSHITIPNK